MEIGIVLPALDDARLARTRLTLNDHQHLVVVVARPTRHVICHCPPPECPHRALSVVQVVKLGARVDELELLAANDPRLSVLLDEAHCVFDDVMAQPCDFVM